MSIRDLYASAKTIIEMPEWPNPNLCPVCDETATKPLAGHLHERLETYQEANVLSDTLKTQLLSSAWFLSAEKLEASTQLAFTDDTKHLVRQ